MNLEVLSLCLHLVDRQAFLKLSHKGRNFLMDQLVPSVFRTFLSQVVTADSVTEIQDPTILRKGYNARQLFYSKFKKLLSDRGQSTKDTLFWEVAKSYVTVHGKSLNPVRIGLICAKLAELPTVLYPTFKNISN